MTVKVMVLSPCKGCNNRINNNNIWMLVFLLFFYNIFFNSFIENQLTEPPMCMHGLLTSLIYIKHNFMASGHKNCWYHINKNYLNGAYLKALEYKYKKKLLNTFISTNSLPEWERGNIQLVNKYLFQSLRNYSQFKP